MIAAWRAKVKNLTQIETRLLALPRDLMTPQLQSYLIIVLAFIATWAISELIRRNARNLNLVQLPNERSSHTSPTPSGGGLGIAVASTICGFIVGPELVVPVLVSASAALLGLIDDRFGLSARLRLLIHFVIIGSLLLALTALPVLSTPFGEIPPWAMGLVLLVGGVWWINLYNFMDGIDGLAASQAIYMGLSAITLTRLNVSSTPDAMSIWLLAVSSASAGFLVLNWAPARIFMGDAGSNFLATAIFAVFVGMIADGHLSLPTFMILAALFFTDATITLLGRIRNGSHGFSAHRLHVYQKLSRRPGGHRMATLIYLAINVAWLYPLAYFAQTFDDTSWWLTCLAYCPIVLFCLLARAGLPDSQPIPRKPSYE